MTPIEMHIIKEEVLRGTLTSLPKQYEFMRERGFKSIEDVHKWMLDTRTNFELMAASLILEEENALTED